MIKEAIQEIKALADKATALPLPDAGRMFLEAPDGSGKRWRWDVEKKTYVELEPWRGRGGSVSNVQSLVLLAADEAALRAKDGKVESHPPMRIVMQSGGAKLVPDVRDGRETFTYTRKFSAQWDALKAVIAAGAQPHRNFVRALQRLRPSIVGYSEIARAFRSVAIDGSTKVLSEPVLTRGAKGNSYELRIQVKGGETGAEIPVEIPFSMPIVKGSPVAYDFTAEVDVDFRDGALFFSLVVPDTEEMVRQVEEDEAEWLRTALKTVGLGGVVVLANYA